MTEPIETESGAARVWSKVIDPRIPLPYLIAVIVAAAGAFFQLQGLKDAVTELQVTVRAGNQSDAAQSSELTLLKFRQSNTDEDVKTLKAAVLVLQAARAGR